MTLFRTCPSCADNQFSRLRGTHSTIHVTADPGVTPDAAVAVFDWLARETANAGRTGNRCSRHRRCTTYIFHHDGDRAAFLSLFAAKGLASFEVETRDASECEK